MVKKLLFLLFFGVGLYPSFSQTDQDSSRLLQLRNVHIIGNKTTKEKIITRELSVELGEAYSLRQLVDTLKFDRNRMYNTNLFDEVTVEVQEIGDGIADILIKVNERWYIWPVPVFKLADRNFNDWWVNRDHDFQRVNFGINYSQYNFRGRAERLRITVQSGFEDRYLFNYRVPYIDQKQQIGIMPEFLLITSKNLGYQTTDHLRTFLHSEEELRRSAGFSVLQSLRKNFYDFHYLGMGIVSTHVADTIAFLNPDYLGNGKTVQRFLSMTYGYQYDRRDNINYPLSGMNFLATISKTGLGIYKDVDIVSMSATGSKYWNLGNGYYAGSMLYGYWSTGERPLLNHYGLGFEPINNVRGYELDLIEGPIFMLSKNSFRKLLWKHKSDLSKIMPLKQFQTFPIALYGKVFADGAYVWNFEAYQNNDRLTDKFIYGIGVGLDVVTIYDLVIRGEYSTNWDGETQFFLNFLRDL